MSLTTLMDKIVQLSAQVRSKPDFRWGVVTGVSPLQVTLDADTAPLAGVPSTLVTGLAVGQRVQCLIQNHRVTVIGVGSGAHAGTLLPVSRGGTGAGTVAGAQQNLGVAMVNVVPSSYVIATGTGSITAAGRVSFTGATAVSLEGVFPSGYSRYLIRAGLRIPSGTDVDMRLRFRASGADISGTNYFFSGHVVYETNTSANFVNGGTTSFNLGPTGTHSTELWQTRLEVNNPGTTGRTILGHTGSRTSTSGNANIIFSGLCNSTSTVTGFTLYPASSSITGNVQIFAYQQ